MLSNTAVPKYYGRFRRAVMNGEIPVCYEVGREMNRIDELIRNPNYWYDGSKVEGFIQYCEKELTLTDGSDVKLLDTFKLWAESVLGWYYYEEVTVFIPDKFHPGMGRYEKRFKKRRLINKQYLIVARGNAKSMYASYLQNYFLNIDTTTTYQITTAPTMKQAEEVMSPINTAIARARGPLYKFLTEGSLQNTTGSRADRPKLASTKKGIENFLTGSRLEIRPMNIDKLQGLRCKVATIDEWLSCDINEDVVGTIEQGACKVEDYLIVAISSEGTVRNGPGDTIKMELMKILNGEYKNDHVSIWYYKQDDITEVNEPALWAKSNPNIGKTVKYETLQADVERAEAAPATRNDMLAKRFGIPTEGFTYFFTYEETLPVHGPLSFDHLPCAMGADLSQGNDFCAFTFLFPHGNKFGVKVRSYISDNTFAKLPPAMKEKYMEFMKEGSLIVMEGVILNMDMVYEDLIEFVCKHEYAVITVGYDPYNAKEFIKRWCDENGGFAVEKVIQGARTESVPLGEIKDLAEVKAFEFDEKLMQYAMGNAIVLMDNNFNMKLSKKRYEAKIDNVAALLDAFVAYKRYRDNFE